MENDIWYVGDSKFAFEFSCLISRHWIESLLEYLS